MASRRKVYTAEGEREATRGANGFGRYVNSLLTTNFLIDAHFFVKDNRNLENPLQSKTFNSNMLLCHSAQNAGDGRRSFTSTSSDPFVAFTMLLILSLEANYQLKISLLIHATPGVPCTSSDQPRPTG